LSTISPVTFLIEKANLKSEEPSLTLIATAVLSPPAAEA
jgi:hypothetical protein